jgi:diketogulonate reductase-like aldo/keto reductase
MPLLGFGTWQLHGETGYAATRLALETGYRHLDTATVYGNQRAVGRALADSGVAPDDVFITTKIPPFDVGRERRTLTESLHDLGVDRLDLWLLHWPLNGHPQPDTWCRMAELRAEGLVRDIGVSNYTLAQVDALVADTGILPAVNQVRWSPALFDREVLAGHAERGIPLAGFSPLSSSRLKEPVLEKIAGVHGVSPAQVVLRWHLEHGVAVLPRSSNPLRIRANLDVASFALTPEEVALVDGLAGSS